MTDCKGKEYGCGDSLEELLDVLDNEGNPTGVRRHRKSVHALGLPHMSVHVWLVNSFVNFFFSEKRVILPPFPIMD